MSKANIKNRKFSVVHEDADILIVSKPAGVLSVPIKFSRAANLKDLLNEYLYRKKQRALIVHRIDRYTSGLIVFAKNKKSREQLVDQFLAHTPKRIYLALVRGILKPEKGQLKHYLKQIDAGFRQVVVKGESQGGRLAVTHYEIMQYGHEASLVMVRLQTGLKNQIRVQLATVGHPVVGDRQYSPREKKERLIQRQALHAYKLGFIHPRTRKKVFYSVDPPSDFQNLLKKMLRVRIDEGVVQCS